MLEYLIITLLGVLAGVFTGLIPGIHPNTVVFGSMPFYFGMNVDFLAYMSFISGLSVSHTFHDFIPALFLGVPEAESALSTVPGAEMAANGRAREAFIHTVAGGLFSSAAFILFLPLLLIALNLFYKLLMPLMEYILLFFLLFLVFKSIKPKYCVATAVLSGAFGIAVFSSPVNQAHVLMPVFSGLFAVPSLLKLSDFELEGKQVLDTVELRKPVRGGSFGFVAGLMAGVFPGIGAATSTTLLSPLMDSEREFLSGLGGVNTSDMLVSFVALYIMGNARSGSSVALKSMSEATLPKMVLLIGLSFIAVASSATIAISFSRFFLQKIGSYDLRRTALCVLGLIAVVNFWLTGFVGMLILITASFIGYSAYLKGSRAVCMAVLIVPAISFYSTGLFLYI